GVRVQRRAAPGPGQRVRAGVEGAPRPPLSGRGPGRGRRAGRAPGQGRDPGGRPLGRGRRPMIPAPRSFCLELAGGVAEITLDRPARLNSLTFEVYQELADTLAALEHVAECRAVILTGRGR